MNALAPELRASLVSIVVLNWNTRDLTIGCLDAVRRTTRGDWELIVVDNGSTDGSIEAFRRSACARTRVFGLPENLGFAGGMNRGMREARGGSVCLLNSDTVPTQGWLESLRRLMEKEGAGLVGPCTNHAKGKQRRKPWFGRIPPLFRRTREVEYLSFFCVLLGRAVVERIGPLDERFGIGTFEDDDYCRRAREAGYRLLIDGGSWVWHEAHATFKANRLDDRAQQQKNRALYEEKWRDGPGKV